MALRINWNYIAGFMDGEGSISKAGDTDYRISIPQTHEGVLLDIQRFTGVGSICKVAKRKAHWKESWTYCVARQEHALWFLRKVYPYLIVKKKLAGKTIPIVERIVFQNREKRRHLQKKVKACKFLRNKGLSYRAIGKKLNVDHGYARRMILFK